MRKLLLVILALAACLACPGAGSGAVAAPVGGTPDLDGVWPLTPDPTVVHGFDPPQTRWGRGHRGVDLAGSPGQVVSSAAAGRVAFVGVIAGRGVVTITHGATRTTYEPVVASVAAGDRVARGAPIGRLDIAGSHCLPAACLHWGWIRNADDSYLDPLQIVGPQQVRLLPLLPGRWPPAALGTGELSAVG